MRLVHAGSAVIDDIYRIERLPEPGTETIASTHRRSAGGGFNLMVAAKRAGMDVVFAGRHGTGPNGDALRAALAAEAIPLLAPADPDRDSGSCVVLVTADAERTFISCPGAEGVLDADELAAIALQPDDWVVSSGYTLSYRDSREALAAWIEALPAAIPFVFDPTPVVGEIPRPILDRVLARVSWLSCNEAEAAAIAGGDDSATNAARLLSRHCRVAEGIVLRGGARGADIHLRDGGHHRIAGFDVAAVDTNGAGDTHIGAFVASLAGGAPPIEAVRYANAAAAISVTRHGGSTAPRDAEIRAFLAAHTPSGSPDQQETRRTA